MVDPDVLASVQRYLRNLQAEGIAVSFAVLFGSHAHGNSHPLSDIDLLIVSPRFDGEVKLGDVNVLWRMAARTDSRIEPIPVGQQQYLTDDSSAILEIARREGEVIPLVE